MAALSGSSEKKSQINIGRILMWAVLALIIFLTLFPFWWAIRTALTTQTQIFQDTSSLLPVGLTLDNFARAMGLIDTQTALQAGGSGQSLDFFLFLRNSIFFATAITIGQVTFSAAAAYAFARLDFPFRNGLFNLYISALMVPAIVTLIPNFVLIRNLGLQNKFIGLIAPYFLMTPFAVFFLRQFFLGINREVEEAAKIDGAGYFTVFWRIVLPLARAPITTLGIITFIQAWNEYLWPLVVGREESLRVLTVALGIFRSQQPSGAPDWTGLMAGTVLAIVPVFILFLVAGRRVLDSIQFTGFK